MSSELGILLTDAVLIAKHSAHDPTLKKVWLDISCRSWETSLKVAQQEPDLSIYVFEPNLELAVQLSHHVAHLPNYFVIPAAVAKQSGAITFWLNAANSTSLAVPFERGKAGEWKEQEGLAVKSVGFAPAIRLDNFLESLGIEQVDFLRIGTKDTSLDVIQSASDKIKHVTKIELRVAVIPTQADGETTAKIAIVDYLTAQEFVLVCVEETSHEQEEVLTFIRCDRLSSFPHFREIIPTLELSVILQIAQCNTYLRSLSSYPGWRFNIEWDNSNPEHQLRQVIWEYFKANQLEVAIKFGWYNNLQILLYLGNDLSSQLFIAGCYEPNELNFLSQVLQPGMTFVDIGANDGLYSLFASSYVGETGTVLAIEPSQREFNHLLDNINLNGITTIRPFQIALANVDGQASLKVANYEHAGQNTLGDFVHQGVFCTQTETVAVRRLDDLVDELNLDQVDVIKMDVEGAEYLVLEGAKQVLQKHYPLLLMELSDNALRTQGSSATDVLAMLRSLGYITFSFGQFTGLPVQSTLNMSVDNIIAAHPARTWYGLTELEQMQQLQTELEHAQQQLQQTETALQRSQTALQQSQSELEQAQISLQQSETQYQECQADLVQTQASLNAEVAAKLEMAQNVERLQAELNDVKGAVDTLNTIINAMESSKFWQFRNLWVNLVQRLGVKQN